ncbi:outer membrane protein assembly factor BamB [Aurantivibrio plasticivorans]
MKYFWVALAALLVGCASTDESLEPMKLEDFEPRAEIHKVWSRTIGDGQDVRYTQFVPAIRGNEIFAADVEGRVYSIDRETGSVNWKVKTREPISAAITVVANTLLVGTYNADVIALDAANGSEKWRTRVSSEVLNVPAADGRFVAVQSFDGRLVGLDFDDGKELWSYEVKPPLLTLRGHSAPVIENGIVYAAFATGKIVAIQAEDGVVVWEQRVAIPKGRSDFEKLVDIDGSPLVVGEILMVASYQGQLMALSKSTGRPLWAEEISTFMPLSASAGVVYATDAQSSVKAFKMGNGSQAWNNVELLRRKLTGPMAWSGYVAVADEIDGYLHVLDSENGSLVARKKINGSGVRSPLVARGDTLYVLSNSGKLLALTIETLE